MKNIVKGLDMDARQERGLQIAALSNISKTDKGFLVPSQSHKGLCLVNMDGEPVCTCPDFEERRLPCKHIYAVEFTIQRETRPDGTTVLTKTMRVTYGQNWPAYNAAQAHEQEHFPQLLRSLCEGIQQPPQQGRGRRSHLLSDVVFALVSKVYSGMSARRFIGSLADDQEDGNLIKTLSYNSVCDYLENPALTPLLKSLIEESASPLKSVETNFAVDSSGFSTCIYDRWFDAKYGKVRSEQQWITAHLMTGVTTNVVTSVEVTHQRSQDAPHFKPLVGTPRLARSPSTR